MKIFFPILAFSMILLHPSLIAADGDKVIFSENFSGCKAPEFKTEKGRSYLNGIEYEINSAYNGCRYWGDVELRYSIRFPKQFPKQLYLSVKNGGWRDPSSAKYMLYYIVLAPDKLNFYAHGLDKDVQDKKGEFKYKDAGFDGFKPDVWYRIIVRCEKDRLKISVGEEGGKTIRLCDGEVFPGSGSVRVFTYDKTSPFDITDIEIAELSPSPKPQKK